MARLNSGHSVPRIGFGTWNANANAEQSLSDETLVEEAIRAGARSLDTAMIYGNEIDVGRAIKTVVDEGIVRRDDLFVSTKLWSTYHTHEGVVTGCRESLRRLGVERVDLYFVHAPWAFKAGAPTSPLDVTPEWIRKWDPDEFRHVWTGMERLVDLGLARSIGVSNFSVKKLNDVLARGVRIPPAVNQVESHPYLQQNEMLEYCRRNGIVMSAFSPLGSPSRGPSNRRPDDPVLLDDPLLAQIAEARRCTVAQVALAWAMHRGVVPVTKSSSRRHVEEDIRAFDVALTSEDVSRLSELDCNFRYLRMESFRAVGETTADLWDE